MRYSEPFFSRKLNLMVKQVSKPTAEKAYNNGQTIYALGCNLAFDNMYFSPCPLNKADRVQETSFAAEVNEFKWYNCDKERGSYPIFFVVAE